MLPGIITTPPGVHEYDPAALRAWLASHGIERASAFSGAAFYVRGDFTCQYDGASDGYQITTWQPGRRGPDGWIDGASVVVASHTDLAAALMDLATR